MIKQTLVLIKPDGVARGLIGEIIKRFEQRGLKIVGLKLVNVSDDLAKRHYQEEIAERHGKEAREALIEYITGGPIVAIAVEGIDAVNVVRKIAGSTFPGEANIGTIRGDFCHASKEFVRAKNKGYNLVHSSGNDDEARYELSLWFSVDEIHGYKRTDDLHVL